MRQLLLKLLKLKARSTASAVLLVIPVVGVGIGLFQAPQVAYACVSTTVATGKGNWGSYYGVYSQNTVTNPTAPDAWVNTIYADKDAPNLVELGWRKTPSSGLMVFTVRLWNGVYAQRDLFTVSANTNHTFKLVSRSVPGDYEWAVIVDGVERTAWIHNYQVTGLLRAMQERHSDCDEGTTHYWSLSYANSSRIFLLWTKMDYTQDNDPEYTNCPVSNTELWVKTVC